MSSEKYIGDPIVEPNSHDVLSGRGNFVNYHSGNEHFRALVRKHKVAYVACPKPQKGKFSKMIVEEIRNMNPPGRFLKQDPNTKLWYDIGEKKALDKTRQALREGAPDIMKEIGGDTDEEDTDEPQSSPYVQRSIDVMSPQMSQSNVNGMAMMAGMSQDGSMGMATFVNANNGMQPRHLGQTMQGQTIQGQTMQTVSFTSSHNAPLQRGVVSHMSMPYGGLSSMVQQLHHDPQQNQQQQHQQQIRHQTLQHEQLGPMDHQLQLQAPLMRSVMRHNSAPTLGMMQNMSNQMGVINLLGNQMQQQQPTSQFQNNFMDLQNNNSNQSQALHNFLSSGMNIPDPSPMSHLPPPRRVPVKGLGLGGGMRTQLKREASDNSIGFDGILNGQNQLSAIMDLSMSENLDDDTVTPMRAQERKASGVRQAYGGGMDMDMSTATLDRMSDFGESTTRFSESTNNISFSNVFDDSDNNYAFQR